MPRYYPQGAFLPLRLPCQSPTFRFRRQATSPRQRPATMSAVPPVPDDTALDMISFALSGPGVAAAALFAFSGLATILTVFEVGPRRNGGRVVFFLRANLPKPALVELPDGSVRQLRAGESVLRLPSREACTAVAKSLPADGLRYSVYRAEDGRMNVVKDFPGRGIDAQGAAGWPQGVVAPEDEGEIGARWEEYQRVGEDADIEQEWKRVMDGLSGIELERKGGECKLCGGSGFVRCHKCGGASSGTRAGMGFTCDCLEGRRHCEWCEGGFS